MTKISFVKLTLGLFVILIIAGSGYAGLRIWTDIKEIENQAGQPVVIKNQPRDESETSVPTVIGSCNSNYILFQDEAMNSSLVLVEENGYSEFVLFDAGHKKILQFKSGNTTAQKVDELFNLIETKGFFRMQDSYVPEVDKDLLLLDSITQKVYVCKNRKVKSVLVQGTGQLPAAPLEFKQIVNSLKELTHELKKDSRYGTFIKVERLEEPGIEEWVRGLKATGVEFNSLTTEKLKLYLFLSQAIQRPGQFVYVENLDSAKLNDLMREQNPNVFFVTFKEEDFEVDIFTRSR